MRASFVKCAFGEQDWNPDGLVLPASLIGKRTR